MTLRKAARTAQYPLSADFTFNYNDTAVDAVSGAVKSFGSNFNDALVFDCIPLPPGAVVIGGEVINEVAGVGPTVYTLKLGVAGNDACYLAPTDLTAAANTRVPLLLTSPLASNGGQNMRATIAATVANATAGKIRIRVQYVMDNRAQETVIA